MRPVHTVLLLCLLAKCWAAQFVNYNPCISCVPAVQNPCATGNALPKMCNWRQDNSCPSTHFCHVGSNSATTKCCQISTRDPCQAPVSAGQGMSALSRWFFDRASRTCKPFLYRGLKGNSNNFVTRMQCESKCPALVNPCCIGSPAFDANGNRIVCNAVVNSCPNNYWCHVGGDDQTTACCPGTNVCDQPLRTGVGKYSLQRWYFNKQTQTCQIFTYRGTKGSGNNFVSKESCEASCDVWKNPCPSPLDASQRLFCTAANPMCPAGFWCHIGQDASSSVCCPGAADPCPLRMEPGVGSASLSRWYFDRNDGLCGTCKQFTYGGTKGNQNNFLSREQCLGSCPECTNPCAQGQPAMGADRRPATCNFQNPSCPANYWCHIGIDATSTVCCPGNQDPCSLPRSDGQGNQQLSRWYLDQNDGLCGVCKQFMYRGTKGNQNNFLTKQMCESACPSCVNPCQQGNPIMDPTQRRPQVCTQVNPCPDSHWCHIGADQQSTVCCPAVSDPCVLPMSAGTGSAMLPRWYYDGTRRRCVQFTYGGLKGSQNMFLSQADCETTCPVWVNPCPQGDPYLVNKYPQECSPASPCPTGFWCHVGAPGEQTTVCCPPLSMPVCDQMMQPGQGQNRVARFYYDKSNHQCVPFTYRGIKGNMNNFLSEDDCKVTCPVYSNPCRTGQPALDPSDRPVICGSQVNSCQPGYWCHVGASPSTTNCCPGSENPCTMAVAEGEGMDSLMRWYFDTSYQICRQFNYRGMKGNQNNFLTREDCRTKCPEVNPCAQPGQPLVDASGDRLPCSEAQPGACPATHFCHVGANSFTTLCCPKQGDACDQPLAQGTGTATIARYYFDKNSDMCRQFTYRGLGGNENSFPTQSVCETRCPGFRNYCPHGRPLLTLGEPQTCSVESACPQDYICHINADLNVSICCADPANFCFQPRDPGPCNNYEQRFGYDPSSNTCVEFRFGGCGGTLNNFVSLQRCTEICCNEFRKK